MRRPRGRSFIRNIDTSLEDTVIKPDSWWLMKGVPEDAVSGAAGVLEIDRSRFRQQDAEGSGFCFVEMRVSGSGM
jgi:hypothetical protein